MKTIHKFPLTPGDNFLALPANAEILSVVNQREVITLYVILNPDEEKVERLVQVFGTGWQITDNLKLDFIGAVLLQQGDYVFHAFEAR